MTAEPRSRRRHRLEIEGNGVENGPPSSRKWPKRHSVRPATPTLTVVVAVCFIVAIQLLFFGVYLPSLKSVLINRSDLPSTDDQNQRLHLHPDARNALQSSPALTIDQDPAQIEFASQGPQKCMCADCAVDKLCGGLWKGISYPGQPSYDNLRQKRVHIVVSHCKADLDWMSDFTGGYANVASMHVITKCGQDVIGAPDMATIEVLPNVGRCDHSYIKYITSVLDEKLTEEKDDGNSIVVFLKDDMSDMNLHQKGKWNDFQTMLRVASSSNGFSCGLIYDRLVHLRGQAFDMSSYYQTEKLLQFSLRDYDRRKEIYQGDGIEFKSEFDNLGSFHRKVIKSEPSSEVVQVCNGGAFAANLHNIKKINASVWRAAESALQRGDSIEEGHFMERSWAYLLASPLEQYQINGLLEWSSDNRSNFDEIYRRSFKGALIRKVTRGLIFAKAQENWRYCPEGEKQYLEQHPDVKEILSSGKTRFKTGFDHFTEQGIFKEWKYNCPNGAQKENWRYCPEGEKQYLEQYPDVKEILSSGTTRFKTGFDHFIERGNFEERKYNCPNEAQKPLW